MKRQPSKIGSAWAIAVLLSVMTLGGCAAKKKVNFGLPQEDPKTLENALRATAAGDAAQKAGNLNEAIERYREALTLRNDLGQAWNNLGTALNKQQKRMEAAQAFQRAADLLPGDPRPLENLGLLYLETDYLEEALKFYAESLGRDPNWLASLRGAIKCAKLLNKSDTAGQDRIRRAMFLETDPMWLEIMRIEKIRVDQDLAERGKVQPSDAKPG